MDLTDVIGLSAAGLLTASGPLATSTNSLEQLMLKRIPTLTKDWKKIRIAFYAHGGLVDERSALDRAREFWERSIEAEIYPISIIWHTDYWSSVVRSMFSPNVLKAIVAQISRPSTKLARDSTVVLHGIQGHSIFNPSNSLIEIIARFGTGKLTWDDIKANAFLASASPEGGAHAIAAALRSLMALYPVEVHVVAHSAGAVFAAPFIRLLTKFCKIHSCTLWAPACTCAVFETFYLPLLVNASVESLNLFTLSPHAELSDNVLHLYRKSTLYLISNAYEYTFSTSCSSKAGEPIVGMERFFREYFGENTMIRDAMASGRLRRTIAPNDLPVGSICASRARGHLEFPRDEATLRATMAAIIAAG